MKILEVSHGFHTGHDEVEVGRRKKEELMSSFRKSYHAGLLLGFSTETIRPSKNLLSQVT